MYSCFFFFKQKTAYEMRISDWSSDVCSSDLHEVVEAIGEGNAARRVGARAVDQQRHELLLRGDRLDRGERAGQRRRGQCGEAHFPEHHSLPPFYMARLSRALVAALRLALRSTAGQPPLQPFHRGTARDAASPCLSTTP